MRVKQLFAFFRIARIDMYNNAAGPPSTQFYMLRIMEPWVISRNYPGEFDISLFRMTDTQDMRNGNAIS